MKSKSLILLVTAFLVMIRLWDPTAVALMRSSLFDFYQRLAPRDADRFPVTIVDVDEASLQAFGQWPWSRSKIAELVDRILEHQPSVIGLDFVFPEADRTSPKNMVTQWHEDDAIGIGDRDNLNDVLAQLPDPDQVFANTLAGQPVVLGRMLQNLESTKQAVINPINMPKLIFTGESPRGFIRKANTVITNIPQLEEAAQAVGVLSLLPEWDGIVRRIPTLHQVGDQILPSLGLEMLRTVLYSEEIEVVSDFAGIDHIDAGGIQIPTNGGGLSIVHYNHHDKRRYVSAADVLNRNIEPDLLTGHLVLIGTSASGLLDIRSTPMGEQMAGVEIWAQWLESVLFGQPLTRPNYISTSEILATLLVCLLVTWLVFKATALVSIIAMTAVSLLSIGFSWWLLTSHFILFDFSYPLVAGAIVFLVVVMQNFLKEEQQRKLIHDTFALYLAPSLVEDLVAHPEHLRLDGESRVLTSLFTDLEGFTSLSENLAPGELVELLNLYLDGMCKIAIEHDGTIDKIIGDALHVIFGAPHQFNDHAQKAIDCGLAMDKFSQAFNEDVRQQGRRFGLTRIGINTGAAVVGNFGGTTRLIYTAYGDTINSAARLEAANKRLGTRICVSKETITQSADQLARPIGSLMVKGKSVGIETYEPLHAESQASTYLDRYLEAYDLMAEGDPAAKPLFDDLCEKFPQDSLMRFHQERLTASSNDVVDIGVAIQLG